MSLLIRNLCKSYGPLQVFEDFSIDLEEHAVTCLLGPSGCGKTTFLNIIGGTVTADGGDFDGFEGKQVSYIFQEHRLLPWKTVRENILFPLVDIMSPGEREPLVDTVLDMVQLKDFSGYYPGKLSGGMKQRAAIARAFCYPAEILLMDEPFKGLDLKLKTAVMDIFSRLCEEVRRTVVFVTHEPEEAIRLGDAIYVLSEAPVRVKKKFTPAQMETGQLREELYRLLQP